MRGRMIASAMVLLGLLLPAAQPAGTSVVTVDLALEAERATGPLLVHLHGRGGVEHAEAAAAAHDVTVTDRWPEFDVVTGWVGLDQLDALGGDPRLDRVESALGQFQTDTSQGAVRADAAWTLQTAGLPVDGTGISVAIVDSGIDATHGSFQWPDGSGTKVAHAVRNVCWALANDVFWPTQEQAPQQCWQPVPRTDGTIFSGEGHGTHVAGIAAGVRRGLGDGRVVAGSAPGATLIDVNVTLGPNAGAGNDGMAWVLRNHDDPCGDGSCPPIRVVNGSYGPMGGSRHDPESFGAQVAAALVEAGVVVVRSAGNSGGDGTESTTGGDSTSPVPGILSVASYDDLGSGSQQGRVSTFSSRGAARSPSTWPDLAAPGTGILAACSRADACALLGDGEHGTKSGTSMAAPHVAGIAALVLQARPDWSPAEVERVLELTAHRFPGPSYQTPSRPDDPGPSSFDAGHGLVDAAAAVARALHTAIPRFAADDCTSTRHAAATDPAGDHGGLVIVGGPGGTDQSGSALAPGGLDILSAEVSTARGQLDVWLRMADVPDGTWVLFDLTVPTGRFTINHTVSSSADTANMHWYPADATGQATTREVVVLDTTLDPDTATVQFHGDADDVDAIEALSGAVTLGPFEGRTHQRLYAGWGQDALGVGCELVLG